MSYFITRTSKLSSQCLLCPPATVSGAPGNSLGVRFVTNLNVPTDDDGDGRLFMKLAIQYLISLQNSC